mmetsp:Transcript_31813/g.75599  ORF Transcript_31813/g.75599 Transcript_31813/m.75599 type:complete len:502 (+) Transcript_31813:51-1556(+)
MGRGGEQTHASDEARDILPGAAVAKRHPYLGKLTLDEVKRHRVPNDCWLVIKGKVYNVSGWGQHPGGNVIYTTGGEDATDVFAAFHAGASTTWLKEFEIGEVDYAGTSEALAPSSKQEKFEAAYRKLRAQLLVDGMFKASQWYYAQKMGHQVALLAFTFWVSANSAASWTLVTAASVLVALFLQQSGWLCHDILHHQVFKDRRYGHMMGLVWGNLAQGFSISWWMNKHNSHHAVPNLVESEADAADGDPDIDTMPFLAWSTQMFEQRRATLEKSPAGRFLIRNQGAMYFPLLGFARVSWMIQGVQSAFGLEGGAWSTKNEAVAGGRKQGYPLGERIALTLHYVWYFVMAGCVGKAAFGASGSIVLAVAQVAYFIAMSNIFTGLFLAVVFGLGHNGMSVYHADDRPDFWQLQVSTTRNITGGKGIPQGFVDWFCGGLQYQVEHHLFPQIPRHNLPLVHDRVVKFCKDEGVSFTEADMVVGTVDVLKHLQKVSEEFIEHFPAL